MANQSQKGNFRSQENVELELEEEEEEEVQKLEEEVKEMAQKILEYRTTLPDQLKSTLASVLVAQRPLIHTHFVPDFESQSVTSSDPNPVGSSGSGDEALVAGEDQDIEKIRLLKEKISSNAETLPVVLKRMKDCMARIDQLESCNGIIHPAFKRKRTS